MDSPDKPKIWETTKEPNLLRNVKSGRYYARFKISGKPKWINLDTNVWTVAVVRISDERGKIVRTRQTQDNVAAGVATMGELADILRERIKESASLTPGTKKRYAEQIDALEGTWTGFRNARPDRVTRGAVLAWRDRVRKVGTGFVPPGAKGRSKLIDGSSPAGINKMIDRIRHMIDVAVERGQLPANPLQGRGVKLRVTPRKAQLPDAAKLEDVFRKIESRGAGRPLYCAELCRGLAYTGLRLAEAVGDAETGAVGLVWGDIDFGRGIVHVNGTKSVAANREVPLIPAARALFEAIRDRRLTSLRENAGREDVQLDPKSNVFVVGEASKALARACSECGVGKLTHHDLRDAFATTCIEAGVDIPTVAAWCGHADGGALLMRTYTHHRRAHSLAQAARVKFGAAAAA